MTSTQQFGNGRTHRAGEVPSIPLSPDHPTGPADQSIGNLVREASTHLSTLIRSEVELAKAEVVAEVRKALRGSIYFVIALSVLIFLLFFVFLFLAELLDTWLPRQASFGIVCVLMLVTVISFGLLGARRMRSIRPPERTISSVRDTAALARRRSAERDEPDDVRPTG